MKKRVIFFLSIIFIIIGCSNKLDTEKKEITENKNKMYYYDCSNTKTVNGKQIFTATPVAINESALKNISLEEKLEEIKKDYSFDKCTQKD